MPATVNEWLTVVAAISGGLSALIVWGFASGKFVQRHTDEIHSVRKRHDAVEDRVTANERGIADIKDALFKLREETNRDYGRLQHKSELLEERVNVQKVHGDERYERVEAQLGKLENQAYDIQRQVDHLKSDDPPERRRR